MKTTIVPFESDFNLIFLPLQVNQSEPLCFVVDTGFDVNVLNAKWVEPLGLTLTNKQTIPQPGGEIEVGDIADVVFALPGLVLSEQTLMAAPLSSLEMFVGRAIDGILGHHFLQQFVVNINYESGLMTLNDPDCYHYVGDGQEVPVLIKAAEPMVLAEFIRQDTTAVTGQLKLDTGSIDAIGFNKNFIEDNQIVAPTQKIVAQEGVAVGGQTDAIMFRMNGVNIGDFSFNEFVVGATMASGGFENRDNAGTVGAEILSRFHITLDYPHGRMFLEPNDRYQTALLEDRSGLWVVATDEGKQVFRIVPNSPADQAGLKAGDLLVAIDDQSAADLSLAQIWQRWRADVGTRYVLKIQRDGQLLTAVIVLADLI